MPATIDNKGIASGYSDDEDGWGALVNQNLRQLSSYVVDGFAQDVTTTTGLTYGYKRGVGLMPGGLVQVDAGTLVLPPSTAGFVVRTLAGIVSFQTSPVFPDKIHMSTVSTNVSAIISVRDDRYMQDMTQDGNFTARVVTATTSINASTSINATGNITAGGNAVIAGTASVAGSLGVGTVSPATNFDVVGPTPIARISGTAGTSPRLELSSVGIVNWSLRSHTAGQGEFTIFQDAIERLRLSSAGALTIGGVTRLQSGAGALQLGAGPNDHVIMEFYPRTATPVVRGGFIGYNVAAGTNLELLNFLGPVVLSSNNGVVTIGAGGLTSNGFVNGTQFNGIQFNGSGAGLTTGTVPQAAVTNLVATLANLTSLVSNRSLLGHTHTTSEVAGLNTTVDSINTTLASKMNTGASVNTSQLVGLIPAANFGAALGYTGDNSFNFRTLAGVGGTGASPDVNLNQIFARVNELLAWAQTLTVDLKARNII